MRAGSIVIFALLGATGCKAPEPTKDEVADALVKLDDEAWASLGDMLADAAAQADAGSVSMQRARPPAAGTQPMRKKAIVVEELLCERVDKTTHRCNVTWRWDTNRASTVGRYSFTRKDGTWHAARNTTP